MEELLFCQCPRWQSVEIYFKFAQSTDVNPDNDLVTDNITVSGTEFDLYEIPIPATEEFVLFDSVICTLYRKIL